MCVHVHIYIYVDMYIFLFVYILDGHTHIHACIYRYIYIYMCLAIFVYKHTYHLCNTCIRPLYEAFRKAEPRLNGREGEVLSWRSWRSSSSTRGLSLRVHAYILKKHRYIYTHMYVYIYTCVCMYVRMYVCMYVCWLVGVKIHFPVPPSGEDHANLCWLKPC